MNRTTPQQIDLWRQAPSETQRLEFKEAKQQFDFDRLAKYCIALANEGGGHLVLGVADTPPRRIVGSHAFPNPVGTAEKLFQRIGFRVEVEAVEHPAGRIVVFHIPSRPTGTAYHLDGTYLMRSGSHLVPMSEDRLRRIFAEGEPDWLEEASRSGLSGQEVVELLDTQTFFELLKLPYPSDRQGVLDRLAQERLISDMPEGWRLSRLGALLLARRIADFPDISRKAPRVIVYEGDNKLITRIDQASIKGYAVGFESLIEFIMNQLPQNEVVQRAIREEIQLLPQVVIRELVANALIHQEFQERGTSVTVEIYQNRVVISNPGNSIVPLDRLIDGYQSRNERLADLMRRFGICEEKGSGIDRVIDAAEVFQLPAPDFRGDLNRVNVTIHGPMRFDEMDRDDRIRACFQHCALKWVMSSHMTNTSLRERFRLPASRREAISQIIAATIATGQIKPDESVGGSRKYARYLPFWA